MTVETFYFWGVSGLLALAPLIFGALMFIDAPYGRYARSGWGPSVPARLGWVVMELPSPILFAWVYMRGEGARDLAPLIFFSLFQIHYLQRALVFPLRMRGNKRNPLAPVAMSIGFNVLNATLNALAVSRVHRYLASWLADPRFLVGVGLFVAGMGLNLHSDSLLRALRSPGERGYKVPHGGAFRWVSSPNYLGEIIEWCGWALATWSGAGLAFAVFTLANLGPRARAHHGWYRKNFAAYPSERRALIPYLW